MRILFALTAFICLAADAVAQSPIEKGDSIYSQFLHPPSAARPRVWWHWMNGNISQDGIRKDLLWMKHSGIGGFQNFDASLMTPKIVQDRLTYMTPAWKDAFRLATRLADSLQLEMAIAGSPGWSESGGPWVKLQDGMKKFVWTETRVKAGEIPARLPQPPGIVGPFQNIPKQAEFGATGESPNKQEYYQDVAVVAFRLPAKDRSLKDLGAVVSSSGGKFTLEQLTDGDLATTNLLPRDSVKGYAWILFAFPQVEEIKSLTIVGGGDPGMFGQGATPAEARLLEVSSDGINFQFVCYIPPGAILEQTLSLPEVKGRYFRISFKNPPPKFNGLAAMIGIPVRPIEQPGTEIAEIVLHPVERINHFEEKAAFAPVGDLMQKPTGPTSAAVMTTDVIDLTARMSADGSLNWKAPAGEWKIIRFGYSLLGIENHPASPEATGPEVDKLDPVAVENYFNEYLRQYKEASGGWMGKKGLQFMITDSWEAGAQNWTASLPSEFKRRRGYNLIQWIPVLTGQIVGSSEASEQFLFDFRKTIGEMVVDYHYDALTRILAKRGMKRYSESHESGRALIADGMDVKRSAAVPMSAIWTPNPYINGNDQTKHTVDIRESASVAHLWGQNLVAAESLTALGVPAAAWSYSPEMLKPTADLAMASGLNRFVIHTSVHQPVDDKIPGLGLGPFGQWFNRHETWASQAGAWTDYLSRSCYLLQSGKFVADILYYYGEDNNITSLFGQKPPGIPEGYAYDFINSTGLVSLLNVSKGQLITPSGMRYQLLVLDSNASAISLPVLRKIVALIRAGARVTGNFSFRPAGLADATPEFEKLLGAIRSFQKPTDNSAASVASYLRQMRVPADCLVEPGTKKLPFAYVHRRLADRDLYWINNASDETRELSVRFRVSGKVPELWFAEDGRIEPLSYQIEKGSTVVSLHMEPRDAFFVVFKKPALVNQLTIPAVRVNTLANLSGPWKVKFQRERGAPEEADLNVLDSWTVHADPGIRYFSGTASYLKTFSVDQEWLDGKAELWLNLGEVRHIAEVLVNGKPLQVLWRKPFRVNIGPAVHAGENKLEIRVTNLWVNRLIGDAQPGNTKKITYTTMAFYQENSPLLPSGLLGPVALMAVNRK